MKNAHVSILRAGDAVIGSFLASKNFKASASGEYVRKGDVGWDRVFIDIDRSGKRFAVKLSLYPWVIDDQLRMMHLLEGVRGFPCGPNLSQVGVQKREYWWSVGGSSERLEQALEKAKVALVTHGLAWLESLRDPKTYAAMVDPEAVLFAALANEYAGDFDSAIRNYSTMFDRYSLILSSDASARSFFKTSCRQYLFVSKKLGKTGVLLPPECIELVKEFSDIKSLLS